MWIKLNVAISFFNFVKYLLHVNICIYILIRFGGITSGLPKNLEFWTIFSWKVDKFRFDTKNLSWNNFVIKNFFLLKNKFKIALQYLFNVFILINAVFYPNINLKLKIDPKKFTFENLEKIFHKHLAPLLHVYKSFIILLSQISR